MSTELKIKVTKDILERSKMCGQINTPANLLVSQNCAIALAVRDIFPDASVGEDIVQLVRCKQRDSWMYSVVLPEKAREFIREFDMNTYEYRAKMSEIEFSIQIPDNVLELIDISSLTKILENHPTLELVKSN